MIQLKQYMVQIIEKRHTEVGINNAYRHYIQSKTNH